MPGRKIPIEELVKTCEEAGFHFDKYIDAQHVYVYDDDGYKYCKAIANLRKYTPGEAKTFLRDGVFAYDNMLHYIDLNTNGAVSVDTKREDYKDVHSEVAMVCSKHLDKGSFVSNMQKVRRNLIICPYCRREHYISTRRTPMDIILEKANRSHTTVISSYIQDGNTWVEYICDVHQSKGIQRTPWHKTYYSNDFCCRYCAGFDKTTEEYASELAITHPEFTLLSEYNGYDNKVTVYCSICQETNDLTAGPLISKTSLRGCPGCRRIAVRAGRLYTQDEWEKILAERRPDLLPSGPYSTMKDAVRVKCKQCGKSFESIADYIVSRKTGCPYCDSKWITQQSVRRILSSFGFRIHQEHSFPDLLSDNGVRLRFDAYLSEVNTCVEYDGEGHYNPIPYFSKSYNSPEEALADVQRRDAIKTQYCADNGINLIRIPYWEKDNLENFLISEFSKLGIRINTQARQTDRSA